MRPEKAKVWQAKCFKIFVRTNYCITGFNNKKVLKVKYTPILFHLQMNCYKVLLLAKIFKNYTIHYFMEYLTRYVPEITS